MKYPKLTANPVHFVVRTPGMGVPIIQLKPDSSASRAVKRQLQEARDILREGDFPQGQAAQLRTYWKTVVAFCELLFEKKVPSVNTGEVRKTLSHKNSSFSNEAFDTVLARLFGITD